jgi:hypothetical protein
MLDEHENETKKDQFQKDPNNIDMVEDDEAADL